MLLIFPHHSVHRVWHLHPLYTEMLKQIIIKQKINISINQSIKDGLILESITLATVSKKGAKLLP